MKACIFSGSVLVLVNGSPTKEFQMEMGLRQGDSLAPFLFLIAAEGLYGLFKKSVDYGFFEALNLGTDSSYHILQYAYDTLIMCKNSRENLWCLKAVLRIFELVSGLLVGLNVDLEELRTTSQFLYCRLGEVPFKFLGIPVGANPRLSSTWRRMVKKIRDRLSTWMNRQLSMGGRITLVNSILASLPLYYLSFFKAPKKVLKEMVQISRNFLWGGRDEVQKMAWVSWNKMCLPKERGGLDIRNIEIFNIP